ncbi:MAG: GDP-fucose synthetase [Spirochaetes bacterium GWB1_27_13]|nr:MAG: GDP-fucose synthetase [Spirochaetes bacterium GWB1_27_13]
MDKNSKIYVAGHRGLVGSAIVRKLQGEGYNNLVLKTHKELDLLDANAVKNFFEKEKPDYVFQAAAKVGGILANSTQKADFIYQNLQMQNNIIHNSYIYGVKKLLFLGSSCIYPKLCPQPIKEEYLLSGYLEQTNDAYAIAKIAGLIMCKSYNEQYKTNFISAMPTNLYGYNDNFDLKNSHVLPALIRKFHDAKINKLDKVLVWGTGSPLREFLFVEDLADALIFLINNYNEDTHINVGTGEDVSIKDLALIVKKIVGFEGVIEFDTTKPDGTPRKLLDVSKLNGLGWKAKTSLEEGIRLTYKWYLENYEEVNKKFSH